MRARCGERASPWGCAHHGDMTPRVVRRTDPRLRLSRTRRDQGRGGFFAEAAEQGFEPGTSVRIAFEPAQDFAEIMGIRPDDEMCVRDRVQRAEGIPVQLSVSRIPRVLTQGTVLEEGDTGVGGMYARLEESGYRLTEFEETVTAGPSTAHERAALGEDVGTVLRVRRVAYASEQIVEVNDMVLDSRRYEIHHTFPAE